MKLNIVKYEIKKKQYQILSNLIKDKKINYNTLKLSVEDSDIIELGVFTIHGLTIQKKYYMSISNEQRIKMIKKLKRLNIKIK
tara:strand:- start:333 stop:581 length:249 start_codon:yes stop_codon:yes gene_type:complete